MSPPFSRNCFVVTKNFFLSLTLRKKQKNNDGSICISNQQIPLLFMSNGLFSFAKILQSETPEPTSTCIERPSRREGQTPVNFVFIPSASLKANECLLMFTYATDKGSF